MLEPARGLDEVAYLRFASVYKGFEDIGDFEREVGLSPRRPRPSGPPADPQAREPGVSTPAGPGFP